MMHLVKALALLIVAGLVLTACAPGGPAASAGKAPEPTKATSAAQPGAAAAAPSNQAAAPAKIDYPVKGKAITIIVAFAPGGGNDLGARILAASLEKELGTPVQVVNKAGAGGQVGTTEFAQAKPDGYTLAYMPNPASLNLYLIPDRKATFNRKSFSPIALHNVDPAIWAVKTDSAFKTGKDVIEAAKANPKKVKGNVGSLMGANHLAVLQAQKLAGVEFALINGDGGGDNVAPLLGGHVDFGADMTATFLPHIKNGTLRALAVLDGQENKFLPGVSTLESQGYKVYMSTSRGLVAPANTPTEIVNTLSAAVKKVMQTEEHTAKLADMGATPRYMDPAQYSAFWDQLEAQVKPIIDEAQTKK